MEVSLTPDQKAFIRQAIETGRLQHEEEAVQEALSLWEERERKRAEFLASLEDAKASTAHWRRARHHAAIHAGTCRRSKAARSRPPDR